MPVLNPNAQIIKCPRCRKRLWIITLIIGAERNYCHHCGSLFDGKEVEGLDEK